LKSLDEIFPRPTVAKFAIGLTFMSSVVFYSSIRAENALYLISLGSWFAFCFFACHWVAASYTELTQAQSRSIDYVYLGVATVGVFVLAMNYEPDRYEFRQNKVVSQAEITLKDTKQHLDAILVQHQQALCQLNVVSLGPEYCAQAKQLVLDYRAEDRSQDYPSGSRAINLYVAKIHIPNDAEEPKRQVYREIDLQLHSLQSARLRVLLDLAFIEFQRPMPREAKPQSAWQIFTWPFILAFALALRLTRTTIEVFDWTRRPLPAAQTN
jgi:hypothetical protein